MGIKLPKISVVTPVLNRVEFIEDTILSVINQGYPNLEYIIVDGGSSDGTIEVIKKYEKQIAFWKSEPDNGMYHAIQKGFDNSSGEVMAWINSDDKLHEGALKKIGGIFKDLPDVEWITGIPTLFNQEGLCVKVFDLPRWSIERFRIGDYRWIQQESVFWRRTLWQRTSSSFNLNYKFAADFDLWCRFFNESSLTTVNTIFSGFRLHGAQISVTRLHQYEIEVSDLIVIHGFNKNSLRTKISKVLLKIKDSTRLRMLKLILKSLLAYRMKYGRCIYYNFSESKWSF